MLITGRRHHELFYNFWYTEIIRVSIRCIFECLFVIKSITGFIEEWKETTIANTSEQQFKVEFECEFLGSVNTLINPSILKNLIYEDPIQRNAGLDVYEVCQPEHNYLITVDVARGLGNDYSAFIVFDITEFPYKCVAKYRNKNKTNVVPKHY